MSPPPRILERTHTDQEKIPLMQHGIVCVQHRKETDNPEAARLPATPLALPTCRFFELERRERGGLWKAASSHTNCGSSFKFLVGSNQYLGHTEFRFLQRNAHHQHALLAAAFPHDHIII